MNDYDFRKRAVSVALLAERLAEGRGSATIATAENNRVPRPFLMPREPRYLQRLVRPGSGSRLEADRVCVRHKRLDAKNLKVGTCRKHVEFSNLRGNDSECLGAKSAWLTQPWGEIEIANSDSEGESANEWRLLRIKFFTNFLIIK